MTQTVITATDITDFSPDDRNHIERFREYAAGKVWRDDTSITLPSGKRVTCKSLVALNTHAEVRDFSDLGSKPADRGLLVIWRPVPSEAGA